MFPNKWMARLNCKLLVLKMWFPEVSWFAACLFDRKKIVLLDM